MKNIIKKHLALFLSLVLIISIVPAAIVFAAGDVTINALNFPDENFRQFVSDEYDTNFNGKLSEQELSDTVMMLSSYVDVDENPIADLTGIEHFSSLEKLYCGGIGLETLDVSALSHLTHISCQGNSLTSLDLSSNNSLVFVNCSDNNLTTVNIPIVNSITNFQCYANHLTSLDVHYLSSATTIRCDQNDISFIKIESTTLRVFNCSQNHLKSLDLSKTTLEDVNDQMIGNQTVTVNATAAGLDIIMPFTSSGLNADNYRGCSLDQYDGCGLINYQQFRATDASQIKDGFYYECYPMLEGATNMSVEVTVNRNFHQVDFYTDRTLDTLISKIYVDDGQPAVQPDAPDDDPCKTFERWSENVDAVDDDMIVFAIYQDTHDYVVSLAQDGDTVNISCSRGDISPRAVSFISVVNTKVGDELYDEAVDVTGDGFINAKDYAVLLKNR